MEIINSLIANIITITDKLTGGHSLQIWTTGFVAGIAVASLKKIRKV
ncbi:MAG: hypothetical protein Q7S34_01085 [bacterium]|nr:hypothetical protein [bacterium]